MNEDHPLALASGYRTVVWKTKKLEELLIEPDMPEDAVSALIISLAKAKATKVGQEDFLPFIEGQTYYVNDLLAFSKMDIDDRLESEYTKAFASTADRSEMVQQLKKIS